MLIKLGVRDSRAARRELHVASVHSVELVRLAAFLALGQHGVSVGEFPGEDVAEDFEIPVRMRREARVGLDAILIQDAEGSEL